MVGPGQFTVPAVPQLKFRKNGVLVYVITFHEAVVHYRAFIIIRIERELDVTLVAVIVVYLEPDLLGLGIVRHDRVLGNDKFFLGSDRLLYDTFFQSVELCDSGGIHDPEPLPRRLVPDTQIIPVVIEISVFQYDRGDPEGRTVTYQAVIVALLSYPRFDILAGIALFYPLVHYLLAKRMTYGIALPIRGREYLRSEEIMVGGSIIMNGYQNIGIYLIGKLNAACQGQFAVDIPGKVDIDVAVFIKLIVHRERSDQIYIFFFKSVIFAPGIGLVRFLGPASVPGIDNDRNNRRCVSPARGAQSKHSGQYQAEKHKK